MITIKRPFGRSVFLAAAFVFGAALVVPALTPGSAVHALGQYSSRSLSLSSSALNSVTTGSPGSGNNGAKVKYTFTFTPATTATAVGGYLIEFCTTPLFGTTCTAPTGLDASTVATIPTETNFAATAPTLDTTTNATNTGTNFFASNSGAEACQGTAGLGRQNCILLKRTTPVTESGSVLTLSFGQGAGTDWIKNPGTTGPFFARISSFTDSTYNTLVDQGAVAASINTSVDITAKVQEKLNFSVSATNTPYDATCPAETGSGALSLGNQGVLDMATGYDGYSYWRLSTNSANGTAVYYSGATLTSPQAYTIAPITSLASSTPGTEQFGLGFDSGNAAQSFTQMIPETSPTNFTPTTGTLASGTPKFYFGSTSLTSPVKLAHSTAAVSCDTGAMRYVANIAPTTKAGIYTTSIYYIATATY